MTDAPMDWMNVLASQVQIRGKFPNGAPSLDKMTLREVVMRAYKNVEIYLDFVEIPEGAPKRWFTKRCPIIQIRIHLARASNCKIASPDTWGDGACSVTLVPGCITVIGKENKTLITMNFTEASADISPNADHL
jgi:hypothetical protein